MKIWKLGLEERGGENISSYVEIYGEMDPKKSKKDIISQKIEDIKKAKRERKRGK